MKKLLNVTAKKLIQPTYSMVTLPGILMSFLVFIETNSYILYAISLLLTWVVWAICFLFGGDDER